MDKGFYCYMYNKFFNISAIISSDGYSSIHTIEIFQDSISILGLVSGIYIGVFIGKLFTRLIFQDYRSKRLMACTRICVKSELMKYKAYYEVAN